MHFGLGKILRQREYPGPQAAAHTLGGRRSRTARAVSRLVSHRWLAGSDRRASLSPSYRVSSPSYPPRNLLPRRLPPSWWRISSPGQRHIIESRRGKFLLPSPFFPVIKNRYPPKSGTEVSIGRPFFGCFGVTDFDVSRVLQSCPSVAFSRRRRLVMFSGSVAIQQHEMREQG